MGSQTSPSPWLSSFSSSWVVSKPSQAPLNHSKFFFPVIPRVWATHTLSPQNTIPRFLKFSKFRIWATLDEKDQTAANSVLVQEKQTSGDVEDSIKVLKEAAKTRNVAAERILSAFSVIEKAKLDPSGFLNTLGASESPGRTWMLIFTAEKKLKRGRYFPVTAVQRFDAAAKRIENGVYLGPIGFLTFEGRFSWKKRILAFIFERIRIKLGPFAPIEISFGQKDSREPSNTKDPFFVWFYIDEEIAVARGKSGGTAFWCRCRRVSSS